MNWFRRPARPSITSALLLVLTLLPLTACGVPLNDTPVDAGGKSGPPTTVKRGRSDAALPVRIFFFRDGRFDWVERRDTASSTTHPEFAIRNTIESLKAGLLPREREGGFTSPLEAIVADTDLSLAVVVVDGVAEINLSTVAGVIRGLTDQQRRAVIAQLALTSLLASPGIGGVRFVVDDQFITLVNQSGSLGPEYHVADFPCLEEDRRCSLPEVVLPPVTPDDSQLSGATESGVEVSGSLGG